MTTRVYVRKLVKKGDQPKSKRWYIVGNRWYYRHSRRKGRDIHYEPNLHEGLGGYVDRDNYIYVKSQGRNYAKYYAVGVWEEAEWGGGKIYRLEDSDIEYLRGFLGSDMRIWHFHKNFKHPPSKSRIAQLLERGEISDSED